MSFEASDLFIWLRLIIDILLVWFLLYAGLKLLGNNRRTIQIVKGLLLILLVKYLATELNLEAVSALLDTFLNWGVVFILVVLQPEIRQILERMGKSSPLLSKQVAIEDVEGMINEIVKACEDMSEHKTGALISIEMGQSLQDYVENGNYMDTPVSSYTLETIFQYGSPLHDGAVIIQGDKILSAASYLPNTIQDLPPKYGARHRAALGLSEISDAITIIVSEETGTISVAMDGKLTAMSPEKLKQYLINKLVRPMEEQVSIQQNINPALQMVKQIPNALMPAKTEKKPDERIKPLEVVDLTGKNS